MGKVLTGVLSCPVTGLVSIAVTYTCTISDICSFTYDSVFPITITVILYYMLQILSATCLLYITVFIRLYDRFLAL